MVPGHVLVHVAENKNVLWGEARKESHELGGHAGKGFRGPGLHDKEDVAGVGETGTFWVFGGLEGGCMLFAVGETKRWWVVAVVVVGDVSFVF